MGHDLTENLSIDLGVVGQSLNNTNTTGRYLSMAGHRNAVAIAIGGAQADKKTTKIEWLQAKTDVGGSAKAVTSGSATGTSGTKDTACTIALASVAATDIVTINGVAFTCAASTDAAAAKFADDDGLEDCIQASSINGQVTATASADVVTVVAKDGYTVTVSKTEKVGTITLATTQHMVIAEVGEDDLDRANGFYYVAPKITVTGNGVYAVVVLRDNKRVPFTQLAQAVTAL